MREKLMCYSCASQFAPEEFGDPTLSSTTGWRVLTPRTWCCCQCRLCWMPAWHHLAKYRCTHTPRAQSQRPCGRPAAQQPRVPGAQGTAQPGEGHFQAAGMLHYCYVSLVAQLPHIAVVLVLNLVFPE